MPLLYQRRNPVFYALMKMGMNGIIKGSRQPSFGRLLATSFALDKGKPRENAGRKATGLSRSTVRGTVLAAGLPNCDDYEGETMITIGTGKVAAGVTLALLGIVLGGLPSVAHAADIVQAPGKANIAVGAAKPVVRIADAMVQEREVLSDGTVRTQTTILPAKPQSEKANRVRKTGK